MKLRVILMPLLAATALTSACISSEPRYGSSDRGNVRSTPDRSVGVIDSIAPGRDGNDSALLGTVVGGVVGAAAGHQVGEGRTNDVATVAGAVGGAVVGRKIDKARDRNNHDENYIIGVRLNDGSHQTITQERLGDLRVGDSVRIENGGVRRF
jgi:outer membrane lipoprotein SlyB